MKGLVVLFLFLVSLVASAQEHLSDKIPHPFIAKDVSGENKVMSITDGMTALQVRIDMIKNAKKNIEVEYFIYDADLSGKIITRELIAAAKRGVKVRLLIDKSKPIFEFHEGFAKLLFDQGIEVRYYNNASIVRVSTVQFRNHRKLISVDDEVAITGGRNIGDDYFDLSPKFNFNDTDILVRGPVVKTIRESFDQYFDHKISERPKLPESLSSEVSSFLEESEEESVTREKIAKRAAIVLEASKMHACPELTYVTDAPGANFFSRLNPRFDAKYKFVRKVLFDKINEIDKSILISSPYLIGNKHSKRLMKHLLKKKVDITVYTNSLASTDAVYVASNLYFEVFKWTSKGIKIFLHDGKYINNNPELDEEVKNARWGTHTKAQVYEASNFTEAMIGTYNIDNRSNFYNSEMAVFCRGNDEFTKTVKSEIVHMMNNGIQIHSDGTATDREGKPRSIFGTSKKDLKLMSIIFLPAWLLKFLL